MWRCHVSDIGQWMCIYEHTRYTHLSCVRVSRAAAKIGPKIIRWLSLYKVHACARVGMCVVCLCVRESGGVAISCVLGVGGGECKTRWSFAHGHLEKKVFCVVVGAGDGGGYGWTYEDHRRDMCCHVLSHGFYTVDAATWWWRW